MAMDLISIAEINGEDSQYLRAQRAFDIASNSTSKPVQRLQQRDHGARVSARHAINGQPFNN